MNKFFVSFRKLATIVLFLFGAVAFASAAAPPPGKVTNVNQSARTFTVQWSVHAASKHNMATAYTGSSRERTFKTTDKTTYQVGNAKGSFSDLQKGVLVNVKAHGPASDRVADNVEIVKSS